MITKYDLKSLGYITSTPNKHRIIGSKGIIITNSEFFHFYIVLSYRAKQNHLIIKKYDYNESLECLSFEELEDIKRNTLYDGIIRDKVHLEQVLEDVLKYYIEKK